MPQLDKFSSGSWHSGYRKWFHDQPLSLSGCVSSGRRVERRLCAPRHTRRVDANRMGGVKCFKGNGISRGGEIRARSSFTRQTWPIMHPRFLSLSGCCTNRRTFPRVFTRTMNFRNFFYFTRKILPELLFNSSRRQWIFTDFFNKFSTVPLSNYGILT